MRSATELERHEAKEAHPQATLKNHAPGIFGAASAYRSAKQLGHSVTVAERHYVDVVRGIPKDARTLEAAMQCAELIAAIGKVQRTVPSVARTRVNVTA